jgi:hypothetical protein
MLSLLVMGAVGGLMLPSELIVIVSVQVQSALAGCTFNAEGNTPTVTSITIKAETMRFIISPTS